MKALHHIALVWLYCMGFLGTFLLAMQLPWWGIAVTLLCLVALV